MKKFFSLVAILALCSFPVLAQDSLPKTINFNYTIEGGCVLELSASTLLWTAIPVPVLADEWVTADDVPITIDIAFKLDSGHVARLKHESGDFLRVGDSKVMNPSGFFKSIFTGDISGEFPFPATGAEIQIWDSATAFGRASASLEVQFFSQLEFGSPGDWTGVYILTVFDEVV